MRPVLFEIADFPIYSYGFTIFIAFLLAIFLAQRAAPAAGFKKDHVFDVAIMTIILAIIGSRIFFVALYWDYFSQNPFEIFAVRQGGLSFYGGFLAPLIGGFFYARKKKISMLAFLDFISPYVALGYSITRIGCFLNGCCYGVPTDSFLGVVFPTADHLARHPTQLYSTAAMLVVFVLVLLIQKKPRPRGVVFFSFIFLYGIYRFVVEFFRVSPAGYWGLNLSQNAIIPVMVIALAFIFFRTRIEKSS